MKARWTTKLSEGVYTRLCNCRTIKADLPELVNTLWVAYQEEGTDKTKGYTKEDALCFILELLDCNSCYIDLTKEEYETLCR